MLPFIAILLCTLGCLLFVTLAIGALNMSNSSDVWDPSDITHQDKLPVLIEWDGDTAVVQLDTGDVRVKCTFAENGSQGANDGITQLIEMMASRSATRYALFAVRPSGFATFRQILYEFNSRNMSVGYEPEPQAKKVRLSLPHDRKRIPVSPVAENHL